MRHLLVSAGLRIEHSGRDIPTLNLTFLGADADDPFVVFSCGIPCVLAILDCMANNDRIVGMYEYC